MVALQQSPLPVVCEWCGQELARVQIDAQYCSNAHRQAHYRWRKRLAVAGLKASTAILQVTTYLNYPASCELARETLTQLAIQTSSALNQELAQTSSAQACEIGEKP